MSTATLMSTAMAMVAIARTVMGTRMATIITMRRPTAWAGPSPSAWS